MTNQAASTQPTPLSNAPTFIPASTSIPSTASAPILGKATIEGRIVSSRTGQPLASTTVWLAQVYGEGSAAQYVLNGSQSPSALTTSAGLFSIVNVDATNYVIVVGDPYAKHVIVSDDAGNARVWPLSSSQVFNTKDIRVDLGQ